jgi:predicted dehydrogenase
VKLAIAGCGRITGVGYAAALRHAPGVELIAVADPDRDRRERVAASAPGEPRPYATVAAMLDTASPDALVVASPPECHLEHAELACAAGIPALVEKPPGRDAAEAERLAALEPAVWVGFNRRFSHLADLAPRVPASGELELSLRLSYRRASWRAHEVSDDALGDLGPHLADLAACLLGGELRSARAGSIGHDRARAELTGARGSATIVCQTDSPWVERVEVRRRSGELSARSIHGGVARGALARLRGNEHPLVESLARQLRALGRVVSGEGGGMLATAREGVTAMRAVDAARVSARGGGAAVAI